MASVADQLGARQQKRSVAQLVIAPCEASRLQLHEGYGLADGRKRKHASLYSSDWQLLQQDIDSDGSPGLENLCGEDITSPFLCDGKHGEPREDAVPDLITPETSNGGLLPAFLHQLCSTPLLAALTSIEQLRLHPVGAGDWSSLPVTIAGMLVLCRRASLAADELTPELLLTLLWLLENAHGSQYRPLNLCLATYLLMNPGRSPALAEHYKRRMVDLQLQLLQRCNWRVLLLDDSEVLAALCELDRSAASHSHASLECLCNFIKQCAERRWLPLGTHGHTQDTETAYLASLLNAPATVQAEKEPVPRMPRSNTASTKPGPRGLDGSYWQLTADQAAGPGSRRAATKQRRTVLGPHNSIM